MLSTLNASSLAKAAAPAITNALTHGGPGVKAPTNEPTAVAAVTWVATTAIATAWSPLLRPHGLVASLHGVFCHGSPQVTFSDASGATRRCELADLLIVADDCTTGSISDRRAVLVQAKRFSKGKKISTSGTAAHQLDLYTRWPSFNFTSAAYNATARNFGKSGPGSMGESGRYGGIDLSPLPVVWEHIAPAASSMSAGAGTQLAEFLSDMLIGSPAFGRAATSGGVDDWSSTVDELLSVTAAQTVRLKASLGAGIGRGRGTSATASFVVYELDLRDAIFGGALANGGAGLPPSMVGPPETGPDNGISIIRIAVDRIGRLRE
jgi:hypothetical protein